MKYIKLMGLCLTAVFLMSAVVTATASASAETAEFVFGKGNRDFSSKGEETKFETENGESFKCAKETDYGRDEGTTKVRDVLVSFKGCKITILNRTYSCKSAGAMAEEIKTNDLEGTLKYINRVEKRVGYSFKPEMPATLFAEIECILGNETPIKAKIKGSIIGLITPVNEVVGPGGAQAFFTLHFTKEAGMGKPADPKFEGEGPIRFEIETSLKSGYQGSAMEGLSQLFPLIDEEISA